MLYDTSKPILHRDGDLVFVTADGVKGIIEVKSSVDNNKLSKALKILADNSEFIYGNLDGISHGDLFVGLFAYEANLARHACPYVLAQLRNAANGREERVVNHVCLGCGDSTVFVRFWSHNPGDEQWPAIYDRWHSYHVESLAPGYFINNVVKAVSGPSTILDRGIWFPLEGKEGSVRTQDTPMKIGSNADGFTLAKQLKNACLGSCVLSSDTCT